MCKEVSSQEVYDALFEIAPLKAPGIGGRTRGYDVVSTY